MSKNVRDIPGAEVREVIVVTFNRGTGEGVDDPVRRVTAYFDLDGTLLAVRDTTDDMALESRMLVRRSRSVPA